MRGALPMNDTRHITGLKALSSQLSELGAAAGGKALRAAALQATQPLIEQLRSSVPKGHKPHKTYKGRLVAPGFLSRSLKRVTRISKDRRTVRVMIGVKREAFYG